MASDRCSILSSLAGKQWGWRKDSLRKVYLTTQRSVLDYATPAWRPWLSETQRNRLETAQNKALRLVTGQYASTPVEALRLEAGVTSYKTHSSQLTTLAAEKALRLPVDHPRRTTFQPNTGVGHRLKLRSSWREATKLRNTLPTTSYEVEPFPSSFQVLWSICRESRQICPKPHLDLMLVQSIGPSCRPRHRITCGRKTLI